MNQDKKFLYRKGTQIIILLFFLATIALQLFYNIYGMDQFSWLTQIHGDITFQVERFLIYSKFPGIEQVYSTPVDYGAELFWLIPLFKLFNFIIGSKPINAYYVITLFHLGMSLYAFFYIAKDLLQKEKILFYFLLFSSPYLMTHIGFVKPDPSVVLLCTVAALSEITSLNKGHKHWFLAAVFIGLGFGTKWWSVFAFPILIYYSVNSIAIYKREILFCSKIISVAIMAITCLSLNYLIPEASALILKSQLVNKEVISEFLTHYKWLLNLVFSIVPIVFYYLIKSLIRSEFFISKLIVSIIYSSGISFGTFIIYELPFIFSGFFLKSYASWIFEISRIDKALSPEFNILDNILNWSADLAAYNYIGVFFVFILFSFVFAIKKVEIKEKVYIQYLVIFTTFIIFAVRRNNLTMISMLIPMWSYVFIKCWRVLFSFKHSFGLLSLLIIYQACYQNLGKLGSISQMYMSRMDYKKSVLDLNYRLMLMIPGKNKLFLCERIFPYDENQFSVNFLGKVNCRNNLDQVIDNDLFRPLIIDKVFLETFSKADPAKRPRHANIDFLDFKYTVFY